MFEDDLQPPSTVEELMLKLNSELEKYASLMKELEELDKRCKEIAPQANDSRFMIKSLQEMHINLFVAEFRAE